MATTKKTHPPKKAPVTVKSKKKAKAAPQTWRFYVVSVGIFLVAVATVIVIGLLTSSYIVNNMQKARLDRINGIYTSLHIDDTYTLQKMNVFGDKRVYDWDKSRSYSSEVDYLHGDTVSNTVAQLDAKIKAAGFMFVDEPYPGSVQVQYHYKSADGEYIRLTVSSKPYDDAWQYAISMGKEPSDSIFSMDKNAGPASVVIKVNLDDNNE